MPSTAFQVLRKSILNPRRAALRLVLMARLARSSVQADRARLLRAISELWHVDGQELLEEYRTSDYATWYRERYEEVDLGSSGSRMGTSGMFTCELLYLLVRAAKPQVVVETGVLYGASSGHMLAALAANGTGRLHSIDLGCSPSEPSHDLFVHPDHRARWEYIVGDTRRELPLLLARLGRIDMFHHDSLHTFAHMTWEYETASAHLAPGGILASHDVLIADSLRGIFRENAFPAFCRQRQLEYTIVQNSGIAIRPTPLAPSSRPEAAASLGSAPASVAFGSGPNLSR
jgi:predicted O-methyltransferase YrrM